MATVLILEPIFDEDLQPEQHAYRADHDAHRALREVQGWLDQGYTEIVDADLSGYFDSIPHHEPQGARPEVSDFETCCLPGRCGWSRWGRGNGRAWWKT